MQPGGAAPGRWGNSIYGELLSIKLGVSPRRLPRWARNRDGSGKWSSPCWADGGWRRWHPRKRRYVAGSCGSLQPRCVCGHVCPREPPRAHSTLSCLVALGRTPRALVARASSPVRRRLRPRDAGAVAQGLEPNIRRGTVRRCILHHGPHHTNEHLLFFAGTKNDLMGAARVRRDWTWAGFLEEVPSEITATGTSCCLAHDTWRTFGQR